MTTKSRTLSFSQRGLKYFEAQMWLFTRLSALGMYLLVLVAIIGALVMGARTDMNFADLMRWAFTPNNTHVQSSNVPDLAPWSTPFWRLVATAMVLLATSHGVHGMVVVIDDYISSERWRLWNRLLHVIMMLAIMAAGVYVIWTS
jgi:succinate dehydrogenase hydrophobic anchor subunit